MWLVVSVFMSVCEQEECLLVYPHTSSHASVLRPLRLGAIWDAKSWRYLGVGHRQLGSLVNPGCSGGLRHAVLLELKPETKC